MSEAPAGPERAVLGWREWVALPELGLEQVKAKVDTGARTSALHAFEVNTEETADGLRARFAVHPDQRDEGRVAWCVAPVVDRRIVRDSGGHEEERLVIMTSVAIAGRSWPIEMTLTSRDNMGFRMLLGRTAIRGDYVVDPARSYVLGKRRRARRTGERRRGKEQGA